MFPDTTLSYLMFLLVLINRNIPLPELHYQTAFYNLSSPPIGFSYLLYVHYTVHSVLPHAAPDSTLELPHLSVLGIKLKKKKKKEETEGTNLPGHRVSLS